MSKPRLKFARRHNLIAWISLCLSTLLISLACFAFSPEVYADQGSSSSSVSTTESSKSSSETTTNDVMLDGQVLFPIDASAGRLNREARAKTVSESIRAFAANRAIDLDSLRIIDQPNRDETQIRVGETILLTVNEDDAKAADKDRSRLARQRFEVIKDAVSQYRETYSPEQMLIGAGKAVIATIVFLVLLWLLNRIFRLLRVQARNQYQRIPTLQVGRRELLNPEQIRTFLVRGATLTRFLVILALFSVYLNTVLSFFPQTRSISVGVFSSILSGFGQLFQGVISYIPKLIFLMILGYVAFYLLKFVRFLFQEIEEGAFSIPGFEQEWALPTARIAQFLILAFFGIIAFPYLPGAGSDAFQGISIFLGILISLGSSTAIGNIIAGILLTYTRAFRIGDEVEIGGVSGTVVEKGLLVTRICTDHNHYVSIPNGNVLSTNVTNFRTATQKEIDPNLPPIIAVEIGMSYEVPWQTAHKILIDSAKESPYVLEEPNPYVLHHALNSLQVVYQLNVYTNDSSEDEFIRSDLRRAIQQRCHEDGIELIATQAIALKQHPQEVN